jgi:hypothetical protein
MIAVRAWVFALLATLLVLLPNGAPAPAEHYCRMMGRVVATCCCGDAAGTAAPSAGQQIQVENCCQRVSPGNRSASLAPSKALPSLAPAAFLTAVLAPRGAPSNAGIGRKCAESTQAPLAIGPPLFVKHCALLS